MKDEDWRISKANSYRQPVELVLVTISLSRVIRTLYYCFTFIPFTWLLQVVNPCIPHARHTRIRYTDSYRQSSLPYSIQDHQWP